MSYIVNVRPDQDGSGSNKIEVKLPGKEYMILTERDVPEDYEDTGVDPCLYYAVERIAELESQLNKELDPNLIRAEALNDAMKVADHAVEFSQKLALEHPEDSESRARMLARAREAAYISHEIRILSSRRGS